MPSASDADYPLFAPPISTGPRGEVIPVSELNRRARNLLEANLELLWVSGELSNVMRAASGHWYFSLKDKDAQVRCVMFRNRAAALGFDPENGMQVEVRALPSLYEPRGEFQLGVENIRRAGLGALYEAFERLKTKLQAEGLFAESRKQPLPAFPRMIGVVTSLKAAALRDVLATLKRRAPMITVIVYPAGVQGTGAAQEIAVALDTVRVRREVEVLIVCRGGGSIEDLWSFNEEIVARAVVRLQEEAAIPVVSGVGHETDFTICDFVADCRAPTPTAAAEMVSPDIAELRVQIASSRADLVRTLRRMLDLAQQRVDRASVSLVSPRDRLQRERDRLALLAAHLAHALRQSMETAGHAQAMLRQRLLARLPDTLQLRASLELRRRRLSRSGTLTTMLGNARIDAGRRALAHLDPARVLERGYSIVEHAGRVLRDSAQVATGDRIQVRLAHGALAADVSSTDAGE